MVEPREEAASGSYSSSQQSVGGVYEQVAQLTDKAVLDRYDEVVTMLERYAFVCDQ